MAGDLPRFTWARRKGHFQVPIHRWLEIESTDFSALGACCDPEEAARTLAVFRRGSDARAFTRAWALYVLSRFASSVRSA